MSGASREGVVRIAERLFTSLLFLSLTLASLLGLVAITVREQGGEAVSLLLSSSLIGMLYCVLALMNLHAISKERYSIAAGIAIVSLTAAAVMWLLFAWMDRDSIAPVAQTFSIIGVATTLAICTALLPRPTVVLRLLIWIQIFSICTLGVLFVMMTWTSWWEAYTPAFGRGLLFWTVVTFAGVFLLASVTRRRERRRKAQRETMPQTMSLEMTCPRCGAEQVLPLGATRCAACRFALLIEIEEPRCACGYLLYGLAGDACPECGKAIPVEERWRVPDKR